MVLARMGRVMARILASVTVAVTMRLRMMILRHLQDLIQCWIWMMSKGTSPAQ